MHEDLKIKNHALDELVLHRKPRRVTNNPVIRSSESASQILREIFGEEISLREIALVLIINSDNKVVGYYELSKGGVQATVMDVKLLMALCLKTGGYSLILAHNHPSGSLRPSQADRNITESIQNTGKGNFQILDHLIVTEHGYYSFADEGILNGLSGNYQTQIPENTLIYSPQNSKNMITVKNILSSYPKISQTDLPAELKNKEFKFVQEWHDLYGQGSPKVDEFIDAFVMRLNVIVGQAKPKTKPKVKTKTTRIKSTPKPKTKKRKVVRKVTRKKKVVKKPVGKAVGTVSLELSLIKSFTLLANKAVAETRILNLYKRIEKAAVELKIRKTSKHASHIRYISQKLADAYNSKTKTATKVISVSKAKLDELKSLATSQRIMGSVRLIKRYVGLYGKNDWTKANTLLNAINKQLADKKITKSNIHYDKIIKIKKNLTRFIEQGANLHPNQTELKGLAGIAGCSIGRKSASKKKVLTAYPKVSSLRQKLPKRILTL